MKTKQKSRNVLFITFDDISSGWEQWILLSSDRHHDSIKCDRKLEKRHLELAKERDALILDFGDMFDAMQGRRDPRRSYEEMRPEYMGINYFDLLIEDAVEFYAPYAKQFALLAPGNHESAVERESGVNLLSNVIHRLNVEHGGQIHPGGYGGWVKFQFSIGGKRSSKNLKYHHGKGGNAPVTKGVIDTNRQAAAISNADIVVNGHNHGNYIMALGRESLSRTGKIERSPMWFVRTPGYKNDFGDGHNGWAVEKGFTPTPNGAVWLRFSMRSDSIDTELIPAIV